MKLRKFDAVLNAGLEREWRLEGLVLDDVNLIVGRNASGKSKTIASISTLARLIAGDIDLRGFFGTVDTRAEFEDGESAHIYEIQVSKNKVTKEKYTSNNRVLLDRGEGGGGTIFADELEKSIGFQAPEDKLAANVKRDVIQHPFLEKLHVWSGSVRPFEFGSPMGRFNLTVFVNSPGFELNERDTAHPAAVFAKGLKEFGTKFTENLLADMKKLGYDLDAVQFATPNSVKVEGPLPSDPVFLHVNEHGLKGSLDQVEISQGMFRVLSLLIHLNYYDLKSAGGAIVIDDIGEGLDYERSCLLIDLLIERCRSSSTQLIMSTNDRFVMNRVPLEYWTVLHRDGGRIEIFNHHNSGELFEEFKLIGLNNFDFFATDYVRGAASHPQESQLP